ncbi:aldehyde dehydrogenase [Colidextribacter sp. OB.20]|uniref:aldehyde dehydrogenase n=1 Tax=Colidextribacter sp. OB.20 TaxID=2304568 RepID=UPI001369659E|nr:aldehyde dehydrogenase [Colidextribacter sp. OB.20]NBI10046.1 aldehyde dehydrogenase [Colidextribacter sp. OB.20]
MDIQSLVNAQRAHFQTGATLPLSARRTALKRLREAIRAHEEDIAAALRADLNKSPTESWMCEVGLTLSELSFVEKRLARWIADRDHLTPLAQFPARSFTVQEPYGVVLIMSPWNYPFLLTMEPLIGAIAAGNCCVVKPSAYSPAASAVIRDILADCFPPELVAVVEGGREANQALLDQKFDYIFFTGGVEVGKEVMAKAARHLTPVTLELGGKSPCVVDATARLDLAARRIVFGKLLNCGQTCVAPDYLLIDRRVKDRFLAHLRKEIALQYGANPLDNWGYVRMVNREHFNRVMGLIDPEKVVFGGRGDPDTLKIQPTVLDNVSPDDPVMREEIFGPVLPVLPFENIREALDFVNARPRPLALYLFSRDLRVQRLFLRRASFGGGCVNDTVIHLATSRLPFGGVGNSGMGSYHGRDSFDTFSHRKSVVQKSTLLDLPVRYAPYSPIKDRLLRLFLG